MTVKIVTDIYDFKRRCTKLAKLHDFSPKKNEFERKSTDECAIVNELKRSSTTLTEVSRYIIFSFLIIFKLVLNA